MHEAETKPGGAHPNLERREAFARALAQGVAPDRAAERAGYGPGGGEGARERAARRRSRVDGAAEAPEEPARIRPTRAEWLAKYAPKPEQAP